MKMVRRHKVIIYQGQKQINNVHKGVTFLKYGAKYQGRDQGWLPRELGKRR